jgi:hypothetical protein
MSRRCLGWVAGIVALAILAMAAPLAVASSSANDSTSGTTSIGATEVSGSARRTRALRAVVLPQRHHALPEALPG